LETENRQYDHQIGAKVATVKAAIIAISERVK
jgi:hypothetical protein